MKYDQTNHKINKIFELNLDNSVNINRNDIRLNTKDQSIYIIKNNINSYDSGYITLNVDNSVITNTILSPYIATLYLNYSYLWVFEFNNWNIKYIPYVYHQILIKHPDLSYVNIIGNPYGVNLMSSAITGEIRLFPSINHLWQQITDTNYLLKVGICINELQKDIDNFEVLNMQAKCLLTIYNPLIRG